MPGPLVIRGDGDIFDHAGAATALRQIVHDQQGIGRDDLSSEDRDEDSVARITGDDGKMGTGFFRGERLA
jgi:hypothetical protein